MPLPNSIMAFFKSFAKGGNAGAPSLGELFEFASRVFSVQTGIVATPGGGQAAAFQLSTALVRVDTVASSADSVVLPPAIQGAHVTVWNNGANPVQVFGQPFNQQTGVGDTMVASTNNTVIATGTGISVSSGAISDFYCFASGTWKQSLSA